MDTFVRDPFGRSLSIAAAASVTEGQHVGPREYGAVRIPDTWPADTDIVFESSDAVDGTYSLSSDENGVVYRIKGILAGETRVYSIPEGAMRRALAFIRLRSVAAGSVAPAAMATDQSLYLTIR